MGRGRTNGLLGWTALATVAGLACHHATTTPVPVVHPPPDTTGQDHQNGQRNREEFAVCPARDTPGETFVHPVTPGLTVRSHTPFKDVGDGAHVAGIGVDGEHVYLSSSSGTGGIGVMALEADGCASVLTPLGQTPARGIRCTTVALHAASHTLFCAGADVENVAVFDVTSPAAPVLREADGLTHRPTSGGGREGINRLFLTGSTLFAAHFTGGLLRTEVAADGRLSAPAVAVAGTIVNVDGDGADLAILDRQRGLVGFTVAGGQLREKGALPVNGPLLGLAVNKGRAAVALGSQGAIVATLGATPTLLATVTPKCVASAIALDGDRLAVGCLSGVYLYSLAGSQPRVAGFIPSYDGVLSARFNGPELLVGDWHGLWRLGTDLSGSPVLPDVQMSVYGARDQGVSFMLRNPGDTVLHVTSTLRNQGSEEILVVKQTTLEANADVTVQISASEATGRTGDVPVAIFSHQTDEYGHFAHEAAYAATSFSRRFSSTDPLRVPPAIGERFPTLHATTGAEPATVPAAQSTYFDFLVADCALQWPQTEDLAWLVAHHEMPDDQVPLLMAVSVDGSATWAGYLDLWNAGNLTVLAFTDYFHSLPGYTEAFLNENDAFVQRFQVSKLFGADNPHDYVLDASGVVRSYERIYRGKWPLYARGQ